MFFFLFLLQVHRIVVVDENHFLKGVVSLSDILDYLVLRPVGTLHSQIRAAVLSILLNYL